MGEIIKEWRDIKEYEGLYKISNFGEVMSLSARHGNSNKKRKLILKPSPDKDGYQFVTLCKNNTKKTRSVHRLVAEAFIENPYNLPIVNHKDEDITNNRVNNLEWCNAKYNTNYNNANRRRGLSQRVPIAQFSLDMKLIKVWTGRVEIEKELKILGSCVTSCCLGNAKTAYGYKWKYLKDVQDLIEVQRLKEQWGR